MRQRLGIPIMLLPKSINRTFLWSGQYLIHMPDLFRAQINELLAVILCIFERELGLLL